jgi:hypothetical protein
LRHRECGKSDQAAKSQLKSDRTSCTSANANQMRLFLHTAAHWLKLTVREAIPEKHALAKAAFTTLRLALLKIGALSRNHPPRAHCVRNRMPAR